MLAITSSLLTYMGLIVAAVAFGAIVWSIAQPALRIWPPIRYRRTTSLIVWGTTLLLLVSIYSLGLTGWGQWEIPRVVRFGVGATLVLHGNVGGLE